jgi:hypothetical protein
LEKFFDHSGTNYADFIGVVDIPFGKEATGFDLPIANKQIVRTDTYKIARAPIVVAADDLSDGPNNGACRQDARALLGDRIDIANGQRWDLARSRTPSLPATWGDDDDVGPEVFKFALNQLTCTRTDRDHGRHGSDTDDHPKDRQSGSHFVFAERCDSNAQDVSQ